MFLWSTNICCVRINVWVFVIRRPAWLSVQWFLGRKQGIGGGLRCWLATMDSLGLYNGHCFKYTVAGVECAGGSSVRSLSEHWPQAESTSVIRRRAACKKRNNTSYSTCSIYTHTHAHNHTDHHFLCRLFRLNQFTSRSLYLSLAHTQGVTI